MKGRVRVAVFFLSFSILAPPHTKAVEPFSPPISYEEATRRADEILAALTVDEKIALLGGHSNFFIRALPEHGVPHVFLADSTLGVRLADNIEDESLRPKVDRTTAFPSAVLLAATWNPELAERYARAVGEEARAAGVGILLGPGLNLYRQAQSGRSFEYFGEDPFLIARMIERFVIGVQSTGTIATLKHFVANNTDFYRRRSNSVVSERALHEIYMPGFEAGVDAGAMAVMTAYNKINGEWAGQSEFVIDDLLRGRLGFRWLVMTDWTSVWDGEKVIRSGQDLEMPRAKALEDAKALLAAGKIDEAAIDRMARSILRTTLAMGLHDRPQADSSLVAKYPEHQRAALQTAREGVVLLRNENRFLPLSSRPEARIVATGRFVDVIPEGGGAARVEGYDHVTLADALEREFGPRVETVDAADEEKIRAADIVILTTGTLDNEGWDRPFALPPEEAAAIERVLGWNDAVVLVVSSGGGVDLSPWAHRVPAILYSWYAGQNGATAVAEVLGGRVNPSGKLPITIEKRFEDSPGYGYLPAGEVLYTGWAEDKFTHPEYDVVYREGVFVGYRWYEHLGIEPLFPFGHGLSYTAFDYGGLELSSDRIAAGETLEVTFTLENSGDAEGAEVAQVYVRDVLSSVPRPPKELRGFSKQLLSAGETRRVRITLGARAFSFWQEDREQWIAEPGRYEILVGPSSADMRLRGSVELVEQ
jgi:beta-glucosidase